MTLKYVKDVNSVTIKAKAFPFINHEGPKLGKGSFSKVKKSPTTNKKRSHSAQSDIKLQKIKPRNKNFINSERITDECDGSGKNKKIERVLSLPLDGVPKVIYNLSKLSAPEGPPKLGKGIPPGIDPLEYYSMGGTQEEQLCVLLTNKFRQENGKPPLKFSKVLSKIAMPHTKRMLAKIVPLGHSGFKERSQEASFARATGENVAYVMGHSEPVEDMVKGWINSPPHRANMLGNFNSIGVAFAYEGNTWYGTQFFALE